jgi:hypothetical protein
MDAILFSANPNMANVDDAIKHLTSNRELYWGVLFPIDAKKFIYPMRGYIHISGDQVKYVATIQNIVQFSRDHYEDEKISKSVKPALWIKEWKENIDGFQNRPWKNALVITHIEPFVYNTLEFMKYGDGLVKHAPQGYIRVIPPI